MTFEWQRDASREDEIISQEEMKISSAPQLLCWNTIYKPIYTFHLYTWAQCSAWQPTATLNASISRRQRVPAQNYIKTLFCRILTLLTLKVQAANKKHWHPSNWARVKAWWTLSAVCSKNWFRSRICKQGVEREHPMGLRGNTNTFHIDLSGG